MEIQALELKISAQTQEATKSINSLKKSLDGLNKAVTPEKINDLANGFNNLNQALKKLDSVDFSPLSKGIEPLTNMVKALNRLQTSINMEHIARLLHNFISLNEAFRGLNIDTSQLTNIRKYAETINDLANAVLRLKFGMKGMKLPGLDFMYGQAYTDAEKRMKRYGDLTYAFRNLKDSASPELSGVASENRVNGLRSIIGNIDPNRISSIFRTIGVGAKTAFGSVASAIKGALTPLGQFFDSIKRIALYRMIRSAIKAITDGLETGIQNLARYSDAMNGLDSLGANNTLSEMAASMNQLTNSIGVVAMSVYSIIAPYINQIIDAFNSACTAVSRFLAILAGRTTYTVATRNTTNYAKSLDGATKSANALRDAMTSIDELNVISQSSGGSGGGGGGTDYSTMFKEMKVGDVSPELEKLTVKIKDVLFNWKDLNKEQIAEKALAGLCGAAGWILGGPLGAIMGIGLGILLDDYYFDGDGELSLDELCDVLNDAVPGAVMGFAVGGVKGAVVGAVLSMGLSLLFSKIETDTIGGIDKNDLLKTLQLVAMTIGGFIIGFKATRTLSGGIFGASLALGLSLMFDEFKTLAVDGIDAEDIRKMLMDMLAAAGIAFLVFAVTGNALLATASIPLTIHFMTSLDGQLEEDIKELTTEVWTDKKGKTRTYVYNGKGGAYASGGYPASGELFLAREAGAEMVGSIGGRTAVANNDQIVQAVSEGVYSAVMSAMSGRGSETPTYNLYLDGKQLEYSVRTTKQKRGVAVATGGILNNAY